MRNQTSIRTEKRKGTTMSSTSVKRVSRVPSSGAGEWITPRDGLADGRGGRGSAPESGADLSQRGSEERQHRQILLDIEKGVVARRSYVHEGSLLDGMIVILHA